MITAFVILLIITGAYLIGAIPFGYFVGRWRGVDIFAHGSGNIGATNIGRVLGRPYGILVFLLDFAKGAIPTLAVRFVSLPAVEETRAWLGTDALPVLAGLAAFLGHLYPVYLRFRGGKGVATGAGVVAVLLPLPALGALSIWVVLLAVTRYVSVASIGAVLAICALRLWTTPAPFSPNNRILTAFCFVAAALVILRHRANVGRLLQGTENRLGQRPTEQAASAKVE